MKASSNSWHGNTIVSLQDNHVKDLLFTIRKKVLLSGLDEGEGGIGVTLRATGQIKGLVFRQRHVVQRMYQQRYWNSSASVVTNIKQGIK